MRTWSIAIFVGLFGFAILVWTVPLQSREPRLVVYWPSKRVKQGHVLLVEVTGVKKPLAVEGQFNGQRFSFFPLGRGRYGALVGIDMEAEPGRHRWRVMAVEEDGRRLAAEGWLQVVAGRFPVQHLTLPPEMVELDEATQLRVEEEAAQLQAVFNVVSPKPLWQGRFHQPLQSRKDLSGFGARRIINGEERGRHTGTDFKAPLGEPVLAANRGQVALVAEHFFAGKAVVLDHGLGLYTMYFHLQDTTVLEGELVEKGQPLGHVGATGRATGPHLHFGARLNGSRVNPLALLRLPLR
ncbi:MAG: M23 family metallopeptidase [Candidatus Methylomirabilales bacterium]